jgi:hypothetical protein
MGTFFIVAAAAAMGASDEVIMVRIVMRAKLNDRPNMALRRQSPDKAGGDIHQRRRVRWGRIGCGNDKMFPIALIAIVAYHYRSAMHLLGLEEYKY